MKARGCKAWLTYFNPRASFRDRLRVVQDADCPPVILRHAGRLPDGEFQEVVAEHPTATPSLLAALCSAPAEVVCVAAAMNPRTPTSALLCDRLLFSVRPREVLEEQLFKREDADEELVLFFASRGFPEEALRHVPFATLVAYLPHRP